MLGKWLTLMLAAVFLISCGGSPLASSSPPTAETVLQRFKDKGLPIGEHIVYTTETDPNHQMGRPGGYTSKVNFRDTRITPTTDDYDLIDGGAIEVFATAEDAKRRYDYLKATTPMLSFTIEYDYVSGPLLVRLSRKLTPGQAAEYEAAMR